MKHSASKLTRRIVQILFFTFIFAMVLTRYLEEAGYNISVLFADLHGICPFGAVESLGRLGLAGKFIPKIHESNFWVLLGSTGSTLLFGALFCGWLCPLGSVQDWFGNIGKKIFKKKYNSVPIKLDKILGYIRFPFLILIIIQTTKHLALVFTNVDPYYALFHFWTGEAIPLSIGILIIILIASFFVERPWCRWLCPFGAVQGIIQLISPWKIRRTSNKCIECGKCSKVCPMKIDVENIDFVMDTRCNKCGECLVACPVSGALEHSTIKGFPIKTGVLTALLVVSLFFIPIIVSKNFGMFQTSNKVVVVTGNLKVEDIKGSLTLEQLSEGFDIPLIELIDYLVIPNSVTYDTKIRDIEDLDETLTLPVIREKMALWH